MARSPWSLYDPVTTEEYNWPVNPHTDNGSHAVSKGTKYEVYAGLRQSSTSDDRIDAIIAFGQDDPSKLSYSGFVYNQTQLTALEGWANKNYAVTLTDDIGREFSVYIESFRLERVRSNKHPFKHSYTLDAFILEEL